MSADGVLLTSFRRTQQEHVPLARISPHVVQALIATEDHRFYEHRGIDIGAQRRRACAHTPTGDTQGASTITQQLARNLFPDEIGRARTIARKLKEMITARRIERVYSKEQILEHYLNTAPFLYNAVGIEMAARTYFEKSAADLDVLEGATLVGMLKGTRYYNPVRHPRARAAAAQRRARADGQARRADRGATTRRLRAQPLQVRFNRQAEPLGAGAALREHGAQVAARRGPTSTTATSTPTAWWCTRRSTRACRPRPPQAVERQARALQQVADVEWSRAALRVQSGATEAYAKLHAKVDPFAHFWTARARPADGFRARVGRVQEGGRRRHERSGRAASAARRSARGWRD